MKNQWQEIGLRIRAVREALDLTCATVSENTGATEELYTRYESGEVDVPMSYLTRLAAFFNVEVGTLLTGHDAHARLFDITRKGTGPAVARRHVYAYEALASRFIGKRMESFVVTVEPSLKAGQVNTHAGQEFNYVLSGRLRLTVGGHVSLLEPGDSIYFDAIAPHGMQAEGDVPAVFLAVITD